MKGENTTNNPTSTEVPPFTFNGEPITDRRVSNTSRRGFFGNLTGRLQSKQPVKEPVLKPAEPESRRKFLTFMAEAALIPILATACTDLEQDSSTATTNGAKKGITPQASANALAKKDALPELIDGLDPRINDEKKYPKPKLPSFVPASDQAEVVPFGALEDIYHVEVINPNGKGSVQLYLRKEALRNSSYKRLRGAEGKEELLFVPIDGNIVDASLIDAGQKQKLGEEKTAFLESELADTRNSVKINLREDLVAWEKISLKEIDINGITSMIGVRMINRLLGLEVEIRKIELSVAAVSKDSKEYLEAKEKKDILVKQFEENLKKGKEILENPPEEIILLSLPTAGIYLHASNNDNIQFHFVLFATKNAEELKEKYQTLLDFGDTGDSQVTNIRSSQSRRDPSTLTIDLSDRVYPVKNSDPAWIVLHESIHFEGPHHPDTDYVGIQRLKDKKYFFMLVNGTDVVVTQGQGGGA